jgi:flavodoxin
MKTLVIYYSLTGKTGIVGQTLARELGADLRRIEDVDPPAATWGFMLRGGWAALRGRASPIRPIDIRLEVYDRVFVGSPVWAGSPATAVNSFLAQASFSGASVIAFMTMGGQDAGAALQKLRDRIGLKGGRVVDSFALSSGKATDEDLSAQTRELAKRFLQA